MLQVVPRLQYRRMHLLHRIPQLHPESTQDVPLPRIVLCIHPRLHLLVVDHAHPKRFLRVRRVERRPRLLDFRQQLLPVRERVSEPVEHVFGFEVPQRLELQPFGDVVFQLLDFDLDQRERPLERGISEPRQLCSEESDDCLRYHTAIRTNDVYVVSDVGPFCNCNPIS